MACPHGESGPAAGSRSLQSLSPLLTATTVRHSPGEPPVSIKTRQLGMGEEQSLVPPQQHARCRTVWGQGTTRDAPSKVCLQLPARAHACTPSALGPREE